MEWQCKEVLGQHVSTRSSHEMETLTLTSLPHSYGGKLKRIERQIHHYGSGLNSLVALSAFRDDPEDSYLMRVGYGGTSGPMSNINQDGFAAASFHSWPDTLKWDGISGDYGPNFLGMALGSGAYVVDDKDLGLVVYGGVLETTSEGRVTVQPRDPTRRRIFIGPLGLTVTVDAGIIDSFTYTGSSGDVSITLSQLPGGPKAGSALVWLESNSDAATYSVTTPSISKARGGWQIPLADAKVTIGLGQT